MLAEQEYDRWTKLAAQDAATKRESQEVTRAYDAARAERRLADAKLARAEAARTRIEVAKRDLEAARTLVAKADKALDLAETGHDQIREVELLVGVKKETVKDAQIGAGYGPAPAPIHAGPRSVSRRGRQALPPPGRLCVARRRRAEHVQPRPALRDGQPGGDAPAGVAPGNSVELRLDAFAEPFRGPGRLGQQVDGGPVRPDAAERRLRRVHQGRAARAGADLDREGRPLAAVACRAVGRR